MGTVSIPLVRASSPARLDFQTNGKQRFLKRQHTNSNNLYTETSLRLPRAPSPYRPKPGQYLSSRGIMSQSGHDAEETASQNVRSWWKANVPNPNNTQKHGIFPTEHLPYVVVGVLNQDG